MGYRSATFKHFYVVVWGNPKDADFDAVVAEVAALEKSCGRPVAYLGVMPDDMAPLDDEQRKGFMRLTDGALKHCSHVSVALEAKGFRGAILRSAMAAMTLLMGRRDRLHFFSSIKEALAILDPELPERSGVKSAIEQVGQSAPAAFA
jgi:hypothetical protein